MNKKQGLIEGTLKQNKRKYDKKNEKGLDFI
nr:MAG TPA: hypothetical protein [Caudoviricetes sp.]